MKKYLVTILILLIILLFIIAILFLFVIKEEQKPYCGDSICESGENYFNCPKDCKEINSGLKGIVQLYEGNCMPPAGSSCKQTNISTKVKIYSLLTKEEIQDKYYYGDEGWYKKCSGALVKNMSCNSCEAKCDAIGSKSEGWYAFCTGKDKQLIMFDSCANVQCTLECKGLKKEPIATIESNPFYEIGLPNGMYSVLVEDPLQGNSDYCNVFDDKYACPVTINNNFVEFNIMINHASW